MNYMKQLQAIVNQYRKSGQPWPAEKRAIAAWAVRADKWKPHPSALIGQCADELAKAMREEYFTDPQGRRVRAKHAAKFFKNGKQTTLWGDIRTESRAFMAVSFQNRRQAILGDCHQLKTDLESYNENVNHEEPLQIIFDFTTDLAEMDGGQNADSAA
jgi:hypothetical protein